MSINDRGKLVGINNGGEFSSVFRFFSKGYMIPIHIVKDNIENWKSK